MRRAAGGVERDAPIDTAVMGAAGELVDYFEAHARRCWGRGVDDRAGRVLRRLLGWLARRPGLSAVTRSQVFRQLKDKRDVTRGRDVDDPLGLAVDYGYLRAVPDADGGRPGPAPQTFAVNPLWDRTGGDEPAVGDFGDGPPPGAQTGRDDSEDFGDGFRPGDAYEGGGCLR